MNIRKHLTRYVMAAIGFTTLAACSSEDDWQAGPAAKEGCQQVHFAGSNDELSILDDQNPDDRTIYLTVVRNTTAGELIVPMTVEKCSEGLTIQQKEVRFEDGKDETSIAIEVTGNAVKGTRYEYSLALTGDEIDPYAATDGGSRMEGIISFPSEKTVRMWFDGLESTMGYWNETILDLGGGRYRFENLMESGMQLDIALEKDGVMTLSSPVWSEEGGNMSYNYYVNNDCYFWCNQWDNNAGDYVYWPFYPHGKDAYLWIEQIDMYTDPDINNWYSYYWEGTYENESFFNISIPNLKLNGKANLWWQNIRFRFLAEGEQPEEYLPEQPKDETVTFSACFGDYFDTFGGWFEITAKQINENAYLFEDFMGCGDDITMTIDRTSGEVTFAGIYSQYWDQFYLTASNGYGASVYPNKGAASNYINYMYFYTSDGTDYVRWNENDKQFELGTYFYLNEDYDNAYWDTVYLKLNE